MTSSRTYRNKALFSAVSGLLLTASFPKLGFFYLAWVSLVPLLLAIRNLSPGESFRMGFIAGLAHYLTLMYWLVYTMHTYGQLPYYFSVPILFLMASYLALYPALFAWTAARFATTPLKMMVMLPPVWIALEFTRAGFLTGFPWLLVGYSQHPFLQIIQIADILGVYGVSFMVILANCAVLLVVLGMLQEEWQGTRIPRRWSWISSGVALMLIAAALVYGVMRIRHLDHRMAKAPSKSIAMIQGNIDQAVKWDPAHQLTTTTKYRDLSSTVANKRPGLVVWPETATPFYFLQDLPLTRLVMSGIKESGAPFLIGSPSFARDGESVALYNSAYLISSRGKVVGKYDKTHLVPFGEYVPLKKWLPFIKKLVAQVGDFKTGTKGDTLQWGDKRLGVLICYEIIFPGLSRAMVKNDAHVLINITNDAWFGKSSAAYQHFSMAVFRAVENRRAVARCANTGISGYIDPVGRILDTTPLFQEKVLTRQVTMLNVNSFYTGHGDIFAVVCTVFTSLLFLTALLRRRRNKKAGN